MKMLVTGATGKLGSLVVENLLAAVPAGDVAVSVRHPEKAAGVLARGVDVRYGDFDKPESLADAFGGIDRLLIVSTDGDNDTRIRQHGSAVEAAKRAGVGFIAYTSLTNAAESGNFLAPVHRYTEEAIRSSGIPYAFLRNNWYLENEASSIQAAIAGAPWLTSAGSGRVGWATRNDYAQATAAVLAGEGHANRTYELSGQPLTQAEFAAIVGRVLGREVPVRNVDDAAYGEIMAGAGVPGAVIPFLIAIQDGIRSGSLAIESGDLEKLLGRPAEPIEEAIRRIANGQAS